MTRSRKRSGFRRRPLLVIIIILGIAIASLGVAKLITIITRPTSTEDEVTSSVTDTTEQQSSNESNSATIPLEDDGKPNIIQNEGDDPNTLDILTGTITAARVSGEQFIIRVNLDQYLSSGACSLTMTNGKKTYSATANILSSVSTSTCEGFDVPMDKISSGTWSISIDLVSDEKVGNISQEVSL